MYVRLQAVLLLTLSCAGATVVSEIRSKISAGDLSSAEAIAEDYRRGNGENSEYSVAVSWLARGALVLGRTRDAERYLDQTKALTGRLLKDRLPEEDPFLESAVGAQIEVEARLLTARGRRDQAIAFLEEQLPRWKTWWIAARIHKNLDLLTLEGKPAPRLDATYRGQPVLLFLWAHWCGDCKAQGPVIARLKEKYAPKGLQVIAPTRRYGDVPKIEHPSAQQEDQEIERVWRTSYAGLAGVPHPVDEAAMLSYGVSSTPTLVLIDRGGIVRMYRPVRVTETELERQIEAVLAK